VTTVKKTLLSRIRILSETTAWIVCFYCSICDRLSIGLSEYCSWNA